MPIATSESYIQVQNKSYKTDWWGNYHAKNGAFQLLSNGVGKLYAKGDVSKFELFRRYPGVSLWLLALYGTCRGVASETRSYHL